MNPALPSLTQRFMGAFIAIETLMSKSVHGPRNQTPGRFRALLDAYIDKHGRNLRPSQMQDLVTLSELRNLLAHNNYVRGLPVAEPSLQAVEAIEKILQRTAEPFASVGRAQVSCAFRCATGRHDRGDAADDVQEALLAGARL